MNTKIDLQDVSFLIPVSIDSNDRLENVLLVINYLANYFNVSVNILETGKASMIPKGICDAVNYTFKQSESPIFRHSQLNNQLIRECKTPIAVIYDTDVIIPPAQLQLSAKEIKERNYFFSLPYDGRFLLVDYYNKKMFKNLINIDLFAESSNLFEVNTFFSNGGAFMFNVQEYRECGLDNEHIEGWGHEDAERIKRIEKFGYKILRPEGPLFHLPHERSVNSWFFDESKEIKSYETYLKTCAMSKEEIRLEIDQWAWAKW